MITATAIAPSRGKSCRCNDEGPVTRYYTEVVADLVHPGHVSFLRAARARCDHLTVGLLRDEHVQQAKGARRPVMIFDERRAMLEACRYVDAVIPVIDRRITEATLERAGCDAYVFAAASAAELAGKLDRCRGLPAARILVLPYSTSVSTTSIVERILGPEAGSGA